ncbi:hypothetical protein E2C01_065763 [Portunus trituberculatus]|uniref:Uncharacterized protein n=1 Tax=Portunus trituberculatus TaxID=210409 RepID=A0A5B7HPA9_PORTR|nr:hypothetical protein [Portunus trituberculatus]
MHTNQTFTIHHHHHHHHLCDSRAGEGNVPFGCSMPPLEETLKVEHCAGEHY